MTAANGGLVRWLDERLHVDRLYEKYLRKAFPVHSTFCRRRTGAWCCWTGSRPPT